MLAMFAVLIAMLTVLACTFWLVEEAVAKRDTPDIFNEMRRFPWHQRVASKKAQRPRAWLFSPRRRPCRNKVTRGVN